MGQTASDAGQLVSVAAVVTLLMVAYTYTTYSEDFKRSPWYFPAGFALGVLLSLIWTTLAYLVRDRQRLFLISAVWDVTQAVACAALPCLMFGVRLNAWSALGLALVVAGLVVLKLTMEQ